MEFSSLITVLLAQCYELSLLLYFLTFHIRIHCTLPKLIPCIPDPLLLGPYLCLYIFKQAAHSRNSFRLSTFVQSRNCCYQSSLIKDISLINPFTNPIRKPSFLLCIVVAQALSSLTAIHDIWIASPLLKKKTYSIPTSTSCFVSRTPTTYI